MPGYADGDFEEVADANMSTPHLHHIPRIDKYHCAEQLGLGDEYCRMLGDSIDLNTARTCNLPLPLRLTM